MGYVKTASVLRSASKPSRQRVTAAVVLASAAAAGLGHAHRARAANTVYTYTGPGGTATAPTSGDFNTSTNFLSTVGGTPSGAVNASSAIELDFGGSGATGYTAVNNIGSGTFNLNSLVFSSTSTATNVLAANASANTFTFYNASGGTAPTILQNGTGAFNIGIGILQTNTLTIGGNGTGALTFTGTVGATAASTPVANLIVTYTGAPVTFAGTLNTNRYQALNIGSGATVITKGTLNLRVNENGSGEGVPVNGAGTLQLGGTANSLAAPDIFFGPDHSSNAYYGAQLNVANLNLGSAQRYIVSNSGHNAPAVYLFPTAAASTVDAYIGSSISGAGGITFQGNAYATGVYAGLVLAGSNSFAGRVEVDQGSVFLDNANGLTQSNQLVMNNSGGSTSFSHFFILGNNTTVSNLTSAGTAQVNTAVANGNPLMKLAVGAATLTVNQTATTTFAGSILNSAYDGYQTSSSTTAPGALSLAKTGNGTLILAGASNYSGGTTVTAGTLALGAGGSLGATAITVANGATFAARPGISTVTAGGTLSLASGGLFDMLDGSAGKFNLTGSGTALTLAGNTLGFDLSGNATDTLAVASAAGVSGTNIVNVVASGNVQNGTYNLLTAASGLTGTFQFANGTNTQQLTINSILYTLTLSNTDTAEVLNVAGATYEYWKGNLSNSWSAGSGTATNWTADYAGTTGSPIPNANANVIFTAQGGGANLNTVLGQDFAIASLTFDADASQSVTIGGANTLTVNAGGITVNASSGSHTISTAALALGQSQTWTNNAGNPFTVTSPVTGAASNLTLSGSNTNANAFVLAGNNSYGSTNISSGVGVTVGTGGAGGTLGTGAVINNGTLTFNRSDVGTVVAGNISGTGNIVQSGSGTAIVTGNITTTGTTTVNSGTLQISYLDVPAVVGALTVNSNLAVAGTLRLEAPATDPAGSHTYATVGGSGTVTLQNPASSAAAPDIYVNHTSSWGVTIANNIVVAPGDHYIGGHGDNNSYGQYQSGDLSLSGQISGTGNLVVSGTPQNSEFEVTLYNDNSGWTGGLTINRGDVALATGYYDGNSVSTELTANNSVAFTPATGTIAGLYLFGNDYSGSQTPYSVAIGSLSGTGAGSMYIRNGSRTGGSGLGAPAVLVVNQSTDGTFAGAISNGPDDYYSGNSGTYYSLGLTKQGTSKLTLSGSNSYTGPTTVSAGTLGVAATGSLGNTAITVSNGATLAPVGGASAGLTSALGLGATLSVSGGTIDMTAGGTSATPGIFSLHQSGSFGGTALTLNGSTLVFNVSPTGADQIKVDGSASVSGSNLVTLVPAATGTYTPSTYALVSASGGLLGSFGFSNNSTTETISGNTYHLVDTDGLLSLAINGGAAQPLAAYYTGAHSNVLSFGGNGSATNYATDATGATDPNALPGATSTVFFSANNAQFGSGSPNVVLGANLAIRALVFTNIGSAVTLGGANTLTIGDGGIRVNNGAPTPTIAVGSLVLGTDQTWTNNSGNPLIVSAPVSGGNLTVSGGITVLAGANTYGTTNVSSGSTLQVGNGGAAGTLGAGDALVAGTLAFGRTDAATIANNLSGAGRIVQSGTGTTTLTGTVGTTGGILVSTGALNVSGGLTSPGGITVGSGAAMTVNGAITTAGGITVNNGAMTVGGAVTTAGGITVNSGSATFNGNVPTPGTTTIGGGTITSNATFTVSNGNLMSIAGGAAFVSNGTLLTTATAATTVISGSGAVQLRSTAGSATAPDLQVSAGNSGGNYSVTIAAPVDLGATDRYVRVYTGQNDMIRYGGDAAISGTVSGTGGLNLIAQAATGYNTAGTFKLSGSNTFSGGVTIGDNTSLYVGNVDALHAANNVTINTTSTNVARGNLFLYGTSVTIGNLTGTSTSVIQNGSYSTQSTTYAPIADATLTVTELGATTYAGRIIDGLTDNGSAATAAGYTYSKFGLAKAGGGTLTLSGSSTYSGGTAVTLGALRVNNTTGSGTGTGPVTVAAGATLGGSGTIGLASNASTGTVAVSGTITAGPDTVSVGNLSTGTQTWTTGGQYQVKLSADGTATDRLVMSGLSVTASAGSPFTINLTGAAAGTARGLYIVAVDTGSTNPGTVTPGDPFTLASLNLKVNGVAAPANYSLSEQADTTGLGGVDLVLATPEPTSLLLAAAAAAPLALGRRRRRVANSPAVTNF